MGRIDKALQRSSSPAKQEDIPTTVQPAEEEAFVSPWSFTEEQGAPGSIDVLGAPQTDPADSPSVAIARADDGVSRLAVFRGFDPAIEERLVAGKGAPPLLAEQFRRLAATLHHAQLVSGTKVIMITSANPADGKSLTSANLALTLSESYRRDVLLIDADLRRPSLHLTFRVPNVAGLNEGLKQATDAKLSALKITANLTFLPAGRPDPDPMSGLTSARMRGILREAAARFDWVIIDTAPVGLLADASIVGAMADGALLVIRAGRTPHAAVSKAVEAFGRERILGVVLNGTHTSQSDHAYGADYYTSGQAVSS